jgi:hypothetical protein
MTSGIQILVLRDQDPTQFRRPFQQAIVIANGDSWKVNRS